LIASSANARPRAPLDSAKIAALKQDVVREVEGMQTMIQQMVDQLFSFGELGFQETESSKYLIGILRKNGFRIEEGIAGIPRRSWRPGARPAGDLLGSDIDDIPQANQKPGVAFHDPLIQAHPATARDTTPAGVNIAAALAVKKILEREKLPERSDLAGGRGELLGTKAYYVRAGLLQGRGCRPLLARGRQPQDSWGSTSGNGLISIEYTFGGQAAHSASAPWRGAARWMRSS